MKRKKNLQQINPSPVKVLKIVLKIDQIKDAEFISASVTVKLR